MRRWTGRVVSALLALTLFRAPAALAQGPAPAPAATTAPAPDAGAAAPAAPPGTYRGFPLSPPEAASIPVPDKDTFTLHPKFEAGIAKVNAFVKANGRNNLLAAIKMATAVWEDAVTATARSAYALGWREVSRVVLSDGSQRYTFWRLGSKIQQVVVTFKSGPLSVYPQVTPSAGWGDSTYSFSELPLPALAGADFPLCLSPAAGAKAQHSGATWAQACAAEDASRPQLQLDRLYGWSVAKVDPKSKVTTLQKADRFVEVSTSGTKIKVTPASAAHAHALLKVYPALADGVRAHPVSGTALVIHGSYVSGPYRLELNAGKINAISAHTTVMAWPYHDQPDLPPEGMFDRMTGAGYWPTLRLVSSDGDVFDVRSPVSVDALAAQVGKIVADGAGSDDAKIGKLSRLPGWSNIPPAVLMEVVHNWTASK